MKSFANWMQQLQKTHGGASLMLRELVIPGTHDSATANLSIGSEFSPDNILPPYVQSFLNWFPRTTKQVVVDWARAQGLQVQQQLEAGMRYFDLRVAMHPQTRKVHACHGLFDQSLDEVLQSIHLFLTGHPAEIVLLDFQHFFKITDEKIYREFVGRLLEIFGKQIAPSEQGLDVTLGKLWAATQQVIILCPNQVAQYAKYVWSREDFLESPWPNKTTVVALEIALRKSLSQRTQHKFFVLQGVLTPDAAMIKKGLSAVITRNPSSLEELAKQTHPMVMKLLFSAEVSKPNIVIMDFVELNKGFLPLVIQLNRRKIGNLNHTPLTLCEEEKLLPIRGHTKNNKLDFEILFFTILFLVALIKYPKFLLASGMLFGVGLMLGKLLNMNVESSSLTIAKGLGVLPLAMSGAASTNDSGQALRYRESLTLGDSMAHLCNIPSKGR